MKGKKELYTLGHEKFWIDAVQTSKGERIVHMPYLFEIIQAKAGIAAVRVLSGASNEIGQILSIQENQLKPMSVH